MNLLATQIDCSPRNVATGTDDMVEDVIELMDVSSFDVATGTGDLLARACFSATRCLQAVASICRERAATGDDHNAVGGRAYGSWGLWRVFWQGFIGNREQKPGGVYASKGSGPSLLAAADLYRGQIRGDWPPRQETLFV
jgi:hypothetical protein